NAVDVEVGAPAVVGLDQHADGPAAAVGRQHARGGASAALELVAVHAGAAADTALGDGTARGGGEGLEDVLGFDVEAVHVVEPEVAGFGDDGEAPGHRARVRPVRDIVGDQGVADGAHAVGVGDADRRRQQTRFLDPGDAGHLAGAVQLVE